MQRCHGFDVRVNVLHNLIGDGGYHGHELSGLSVDGAGGGSGNAGICVRGRCHQLDLPVRHAKGRAVDRLTHRNPERLAVDLSIRDAERVAAAHHSGGRLTRAEDSGG